MTRNISKLKLELNQTNDKQKKATDLVINILQNDPCFVEEGLQECRLLLFYF